MEGKQSNKEKKDTEGRISKHNLKGSKRSREHWPFISRKTFLEKRQGQKDIYGGQKIFNYEIHIIVLKM